MTVTILYGTDAGGTKAVANRIGSKLQAKVIDIRKAKAADCDGSDLLILGSPTYGMGDLQTDWEDHLGLLDTIALNGRRVALFGTGDQVGYPDSFVDAMGILYDSVVARGAQVVGFTTVDGYDFIASQACREGRFVGLVLDEDNQSNLTERRISAWIEQLN